MLKPHNLTIAAQRPLNGIEGMRGVVGGVSRTTHPLGGMGGLCGRPSAPSNPASSEPPGKPYAKASGAPPRALTRINPLRNGNFTVFIRTSPSSLVNLDHVATAELVESRGVRAFKLLDRTGRVLGVVREADVEPLVLSTPKIEGKLT